MAAKARAIISDGRGEFADADLELGDPGPGEVLVEIRASGVCHTDFDSLSWPRPLILGHEGAGVVAALGEGVSHVAVGDPVLSLYEAKRLKLDEMVTRTYALSAEGLREAFAHMHAGLNAKGVLVP